MSELILVRHGQASFGAASYDKLSAHGIEQVRSLARHWQDLREQFDCIYSGTLLRQIETAKELLSLSRSVKTDPLQHSSLNEYNGDPLIRIYLRDHASNDGFDSGLSWPIPDERLFQRVFEKATARWILNELSPLQEDEGFEYWSDFQRRVYAVLDEIMDRHRSGSRVLLCTSGGVIALALQRVLQFPDEQVITTNWMVHNSSVTRIKYGNGKISLTQFNSLPHLEQKSLRHMITYR
jgi:broad specificity phosphatase PhoE